ncbi:hypothetical protein [Streptomyces sp. TLI_171]|uniref:hypothetical protein n=1 Tax=Streptomyces sp. TLI_171 TaxID=1938859 RepID=UPI000C19FC5A|nr:hypothetical protein [Streptomyces sp. TLI_171]
MHIQPVWRSVVVAAAALATATAIGTAAPVTALAATSTSTSTSQSHVSAWTSDGWGGGTVVSQPAGINCHQTAWDPYDGSDTPQPDPSGTCDALFPVGTVVTFTATPDPGSNVNYGPDPASLTVRVGYNATYVVFCPNDNLCSAWY